MLFQKEYITGSLMPRIQELWQSAECTFRHPYENKRR